MSKFKVKSPYIFLILILLGSFLAFSIWSARQAANRGSQISDLAYYSKGMKYNNTRVEETAAVSQGWRLETRVSGRELSFELFDAKNTPISQAAGELTLYLAEQQKVLKLPTNESQNGTYRIDLPPKVVGSLQARIEFRLNGARISRQLLVNI